MPEFLKPPKGPRLDAGGQEDLQPGVRPDDRADVPTVHHHTAPLAPVPLELEQRGSDLRELGDITGPAADGLGPNLVFA